jgi:hypothetical protein
MQWVCQNLKFANMGNKPHLSGLFRPRVALNGISGNRGVRNLCIGRLVLCAATDAENFSGRAGKTFQIFPKIGNAGIVPPMGRFPFIFL